jgi:hypothetical protein
MNVYPMKHATDYPANQNMLLFRGTPEQAEAYLAKRFPAYDPGTLFEWRGHIYIPMAWDYKPRVYAPPEVTA